MKTTSSNIWLFDACENILPAHQLHSLETQGSEQVEKVCLGEEAPDATCTSDCRQSLLLS